jgi:isocitrate dehydrogenase kinase/phosphatase
LSPTDKSLAPTSQAACITDSRLAALCSKQVQLAFLEYQDRFQEISERARQRFLERDWSGSYADAAERLHLYNDRLNKLVTIVQELMGERLKQRKVWMATKAVFSAFIAQNSQWEIAESFFNSLTRRVFATEGVDQTIEFVDSDFDAPPTALPGQSLCSRTAGTLSELLLSALTDCRAGGFERAGWENLETQVQKASERILAALPEGQNSFHLEMIPTAFFRGRGLYLVGRLERDGDTGWPLALCLRHPSPRGITLDAVLVDELDLSILFSYTRAYFRVAVSCPYKLVRQLRALMPKKPLVDLYNAIGYHRHGKTELYRDFVAHLLASNQSFVAADGTRGMVMLVFTLPSYDVVFKLIKDRFDYPKTTSACDVKRAYRLVFEHDRAGRLVEAHEFEHLRIRQNRFDPALLEMLLTDTADTVRLDGRDVLIDHAYVERRVRPLNLYLVEAEESLAVAAALDYGQAIKDLAASNIFAGDIFTKNFGVTRTGRVVFYDYDELCFLTDCNFRDMPVPTTPEQEMAAEPWFTVRENDIFPEEFSRFLGLREPARSAFAAKHGDLFQPDFWRGIQAKLRAGELPEVFPYKSSRRL